MVEFIDCPSLSVNYDVTGKVTASITIIKDDPGEITWNNYKDPTWGGQSFDFIIMGATQSPIVGSNSWYEWSLQMEGEAS
jgi:hypothetical protein